MHTYIRGVVSSSLCTTRCRTRAATLNIRQDEINAQTRLVSDRINATLNAVSYKCKRHLVMLASTNDNTGAFGRQVTSLVYEEGYLKIQESTRKSICPPGPKPDIAH